MRNAIILGLLAATASSMVAAETARTRAPTSPQTRSIGRIEVSTLPVDPALPVRSATYLPSGKVLLSYAGADAGDQRSVNLAVMDDTGANVHRLFSQRLPDRAKDNGIRFMPFADNRRIFLGDFIIECAESLDTCTKPALYPVDYPAEVASGDHIAHRWSEMIVSPDNRHVAWTTLLSNYSAIVFVGELEKTGDRYRIVRPQIISTLDPFTRDPRHPDGVLPAPVRGGEVKQFVDGGAAISLVGAGTRDMPDSVVQHLASGQREQITDTPGYTETTIFSPDETLGVTMTTRFSDRTDPAILGLMPRPYPDSLNMGLSMFAYTYAVTGVRGDRAGNIGPALIDIAASKAKPGYIGTNLSRQEDWVFSSPLSWHPGGRKAMWMEGQRGTDQRRVRLVSLPDYRPGATVPTRSAFPTIPYAVSDLSVVAKYARTSQAIDAKVYGRKAGYIQYRRTPQGLVEKIYANFTDDGRRIYSGQERLEANPRGQSTYTAKVRMTGAESGVMDLRITFGPLGGKLPSRIIFDRDAAGKPLSAGYVQYGGQRLSVDTLLP